MIHLVMTIINIVFVSILVIYYNKKEKAYIKRITHLINHFSEMTKSKLRNFYNIFNNIGFIINKYKPETITMYNYEYNSKLKNTYIKFMFQTIIKDNENIPVFDKDTYIPITSNIILSDLHKGYKNSVTLHDKYVNLIDICTEDTKDKKIIIVNFYNDNNPSGIVAATFDKSSVIDTNHFSDDIRRLFNPLTRLNIN